MKFIIPVLSLVGVVIAALSPQLQSWLGAHAQVAAILIALNGILGSIAPQPHK